MVRPGGLRDALYRFHRAEHRAPTEADVPPLSVLPMTAAAREALRLNRERDRGRVVTPERSRELTYGP